MLQRSSRKMLVCGKRAIASGKLVWKNLPITTSQNPQESRIKLFQKVLKQLRVLSTKNPNSAPLINGEKFICSIVGYIVT